MGRWEAVRRAALTGALCALAAGAAGAAPAGGWQPKKSKIDQALIDRAIEKGCDNLRSMAQVNALQHNFHCGLNSYEDLVFYTLFHGGVPREDPAFLKLAETLLNRDPHHTYTTALAAMAFSEWDRVKYQWKIRDFAQFLVDNQCENGQWSYGEPTRLPKTPPVTLTPSTPPATPPASSVLFTGGGGAVSVGGTNAGTGQTVLPRPVSNTQSLRNNRSPRWPRHRPAVGAQHAAPLQRVVPAPARDGLVPPPSGDFFSTSQPKTPAGNAPKPKIKPVPVLRQRRGPPTGDNSDTQYASLGLRACFEGEINVEVDVLKRAVQWWERAQHGDGGWSYGGAGDGDSYGSMTAGAIGSLCIYRYYLQQPWKADPRLTRGLEWLDKYWTVTENPKADPGHKQWDYYYLYGIERAGMLYGTDFIGSRDWYDEGAEYLLKMQDAGGSWRNVHDTCFAILFLKRATKALQPGAPPAPLTKVYTQ